MPNLCSNNTEFHNDDVAEVNKLEAHLKYLDEKKKDDNIEAGLFGYFVPRPTEEDESWYDWNISNWGTKWEAQIYSWEKINDNCIQINFDTAWAPPTVFYESIAQNTEWYVTATYWEPGMGFVGKNYAGEDECYEYSNAEDVENIPEDLIDEYNLREQFEDEEENDMVEALEELKVEFDTLMTQSEPTKNAFADEFGRNWLRGLLKERAVEVTFIKKDGSERVMKCTLSENLIPQAKIHATNTDNSIDFPKTKIISTEAQPVYDIEAEGWRSFRWDSVKQINFTLGN